MSKRKCLCLVLAGLALLLPLHGNAADRCDWDALARHVDYVAIEAVSDELEAIINSISKTPDTDEDAQLARTLLRRAWNPWPLGNITGQWRIRSIQSDGFGVFTYPAFRARIDAPGRCGQFFQKMTGSQLRAGYLYPIAGREAMAFLGRTMNEYDPQKVYVSDQDNPGNTAGQLIRIGANELLMVMDVRLSDGGEDERFELYYLYK